MTGPSVRLSTTIRAAALALLAASVMAREDQDRTAPAKSADRDGRGSVAVLRRDGVIVPFAVFNRDSWEVRWPRVLTNLEIPVTPALVPSRWWGPYGAEGWRAHLMGGESRPLELGTPLLFRTFCSPRLGLRTNYRSAVPLPPAPVEPYPKDGLAISGALAIEPIESVDRASAEWATLTNVLVKEFDRVEEETITRVRQNTSWRHPVARETRRTLPVRLESWYRSPSGNEGWTVSYVEAVRQYPPGPEDKGCGLETLVSGWLHHQNGELKKASDLRGKVTYCDRVGATYMLPFGRVRPRERTYWIFQLSGWEEEWYDVAEVGPKKVRHVIEVYAGGRRSCS